MQRETGRTLSADTSQGAGIAGRNLEERFALHGPAATRLAYFLTGDRELAQDLVQEAFVRIAGRPRALREPDAFEAYLRRTIVNLFTSHLRRKRVERAHLQRLRAERAHDEPQPDPTVRDAVWAALQRLPERQRAALVLRYWEDLSERETAKIIGCSTGAANQLVVRGIATLRAEMNSETKGEER